MTRMLAAIYARQSVERADSVSIEAQSELCAALCRARGWDYREYSDRGYSGKNMERPAFRRMLGDISSGVIGAVVSYRLDRISRSMSDFASLLAYFERYGASYLSATERFDTSSPAGRAMIYIVMVFAQLERETVTERVTDNCRYRASLGLYMGGGVPPGYRAAPRAAGMPAMIIPDEKRAALVKYIFSLYLSGADTATTAKILRARGEKTAAGADFSPGAVARVLRSMAGCEASPALFEYLRQRGCNVASEAEAFDSKHGMCCYFKTKRGVTSQTGSRLICVGAHEPIVSSGEWISAQMRLDASAKASHTRPSKRSWLAGLVRCGRQNSPFGLKTSGKYAYYFCRAASRGGCEASQSCPWIDAGALESAAGTALLRRAAYLIDRCSGGGAEYRSLSLELTQEREVLKNIAKNVGACGCLDAELKELAKKTSEKCRGLEKKLEKLGGIPQSGGPPNSGPQNGNSSPGDSGAVEKAFAAAGISEKMRLARLLTERIELTCRDGEYTAKIIFRI
jgi:site-specific DNA recombinase